MKDLLEAFFMSAAILSGNVAERLPAIDPPVEYRRTVQRPRARSTVEFSFSRSPAPLPKPRPQIVKTSLSSLNLLVSPRSHALPQISEPEAEQGPYPFVWGGKYALPSQWSLLWEFVG